MKCLQKFTISHFLPWIEAPEEWSIQHDSILLSTTANHGFGVFSIFAQFFITEDSRPSTEAPFLQKLTNFEIILQRPIQSKSSQHLNFMISTDKRIQRIRNIIQFVSNQDVQE